MFQYMLTGSTVLGDTLIVLISIILLLFLVKHFAWDKIEATLEARRQKISKDLDEAEKALNSEMKNSGKMRGSGEKTIFEDDLTL